MSLCEKFFPSVTVAPFARGFLSLAFSAPPAQVVCACTLLNIERFTNHYNTII